jgi:hypothetical protein
LRKRGTKGGAKILEKEQRMNVRGERKRKKGNQRGGKILEKERSKR